MPDVTLEISVDWQHSTRQDLPFTLKCIDNQVGTVQTFTDTTDGSGFASIDADADQLVGQILYFWIKGPKYLGKTIAVVNPHAQYITVDFGTVHGGDCNNDNVCNGTDFVILRNAFSCGPGQTCWDPRADLNNDGAAITAADFNILRINFGHAGDPPPTDTGDDAEAGFHAFSDMIAGAQLGFWRDPNMTTQFIPTQNYTGTLADGRNVLLAASGVGISTEEALRILPQGTVDVYSLSYAPGTSAITAALTLNDYTHMFRDTGVASASTTTDPGANAEVRWLATAGTGGARHAIHQIDVNYDDVPTGGNVRVEDDEDNIIFTQDIETEGWHSIVFDPPLLCSPETDTYVFLAAGGADITGEVLVRETIAY